MDDLADKFRQQRQLIDDLQDAVERCGERLREASEVIAELIRERETLRVERDRLRAERESDAEDLYSRFHAYPVNTPHE